MQNYFDTRRPVKVSKGHSFISVRLPDIDSYAEEHFPLCAKHIHDVFRSEHHLKHGSRLQYGLFLKEIGLSVDENLELFQDEFLKKMELKVFNQKYAYSIKHMYGEVGKKIEKAAYMCEKIIQFSVIGSDKFGCPFAHWDNENLTQLLNKKLPSFSKIN